MHVNSFTSYHLKKPCLFTKQNVCYVAPIYVTDLFQMRGNANNLNNTQLNQCPRIIAKQNFLIPKPKIYLFKNSFSFPGALVWNSIPLWIKNSSTIESFTKNCLKWMNSNSIS